MTDPITLAEARESLSTVKTALRKSEREKALLVNKLEELTVRIKTLKVEAKFLKSEFKELAKSEKPKKNGKIKKTAAGVVGLTASATAAYLVAKKLGVFSDDD